MPKSSGGGGSNIFTMNVKGPPPGPLTVGSEQYIDLGLIPNGLTIWFGNAVYTVTDKSISFEIRSNLAGKSTGTDADTESFHKATVSIKTMTRYIDYYKNGRLNFSSVVSSGVEHFWLKLTSRSGSQGGYLYNLNYVTV